MKYKNLVLSGGGCRGLYYLGMMKYFEDKKEIGGFQNIVGTSIGAYFATAIAIGYTSSDLKSYAMNVIDYDKVKCTDLFGVLNNMGLDSGQKLEHNIKKMIRSKLGRKDITFQQLYDTYNKNLILVSICLETHSIAYLSKDTYPNMKIWKAIRMSMSVPFLFKPYRYKDQHFIDGGVRMNFAVHLFNSPDTFGIDIVQKEDKRSIQNVSDYIAFLIATLMANNGVKQEQDIVTLDGSFDEERPLSSFHLNLDDKIINEAIEYSIKSIETFFEKRDKEIYSICESIVEDCIKKIENQGS